MNNLTLIFSLISLGFFGGFTHCVGMCGPFVLTQVSNRLQKTPLENFSDFKKLQNLALLPYQLGRITTYSMIGFFCSLLNKTISDFSGFRIFSAILMFLAGLIFLDIFFQKKLLRFKSNFLKKLPFPEIVLTNLFQDPKGFKGYFLGLILGFIPCGLLYGAFLIAAVIGQPFLAAIGMALFGIATFPSLFLTASGGYFLFKFEPEKFRFIAKFFMLINAIMLFLMAFKLVN
jgi:sulfite exporter TauE/SafE